MVSNSGCGVPRKTNERLYRRRETVQDGEKLLLRKPNVNTERHDVASWTISLCNLCVLCDSVLMEIIDTTTTETQRTKRLQKRRIKLGATCHDEGVRGFHSGILPA